MVECHFSPVVHAATVRLISHNDSGAVAVRLGDTSFCTELARTVDHRTPYSPALQLEAAQAETDPGWDWCQSRESRGAAVPAARDALESHASFLFVL
jgi:hypothetical protein